MAMLGEGTSSGVIRQSKTITANKKKLEQVRSQNLAKLNNFALNADGIDGSGDEGSTDREKPSPDSVPKEDGVPPKEDVLQQTGDDFPEFHNESHLSINITKAVIDQPEVNNNNKVIGTVQSCQTVQTRAAGGVGETRRLVRMLAGRGGSAAAASVARFGYVQPFGLFCTFRSRLKVGCDCLWPIWPIPFAWVADWVILHKL